MALMLALEPKGAAARGELFWYGAVLATGAFALGGFILHFHKLTGSPSPRDSAYDRRDAEIQPLRLLAVLAAVPAGLSLLPWLLGRGSGLHTLLSGACSFTLLLILLLRGKAVESRTAPAGSRTLGEALREIEAAGRAPGEEAGGLGALRPLLGQIAGFLGGGAGVLLRYAGHGAQMQAEFIGEGMGADEAAQALEAAESGVHSGYVCSPLLQDGPLSGYVILKGPGRELRCSREAGEQLGLLFSSLKLALENIVLARGLSLSLQELAARLPGEEGCGLLRRALTEGQERERLRLASDLHDTTVQDLLFVRSRLLPLLGKLPEGSEESRLAASAVGHLELMNENLRQTLFELNPLQLGRLGLAGALHKLVGLESGMQEAEVEFHADGAGRLEGLPLAMQTGMFRLAQELLNNARKHAGATRIRLELKAEEGCIRLHYRDDGAGFDPEGAAESAGRGIASPGLGLLQMRSRVLLLEGTFDLVSSPGRGVEVTIQIPVKEVHAV
ncbi:MULTISPECIES: sensor histidine kinase [Paenibacillus]|uniref:sensor histidine kinase n=1 Tax=Paenibacillus TaxID=44249 RepID=UPI0022B8E1F6|nr:sensor histidine kinase [Paenibacillus caseinilyticus]MCZ8519143.1 sensor histidine kinase [Paenibacillus caseinilyticus]